jgi:DNA-binding CsgD family transcriptional regulator
MATQTPLSKRDMAHLLDLIHKSASCRTENAFRELIHILGNMIPYDYAIAGYAKLNGGNIKSYDVLNITYPSEWLECYVIKNYHKVDPIAKENFTNFGLQYWDDTFKKNPPPKEFLSSAEDFGFGNGYSSGVKNLIGSGGSIFSVAGKSLKRNKHIEFVLEHITPHFHQALVRVLNRNGNKQPPEISQRELEVLNWIKKGKNTWDISAILNISHDTVKFHIKNIMQKLDVTNRAHAVAVAVEFGLIDIE